MANSPLLATATGAYTERLPIASLREQFSAVWINTVPASPIAVAPDGHIDLEWIDGELRVAGPDREANVEAIRPGTTVIGFRFQPGAAQHWLRASAATIVGARLPLRSFCGRDPLDLAGVARGERPEAIAERLEAVLARRAERIAAPDPAAAYIRRILDGEHDAQVDVVRILCSTLGVSARTLRRRCHDAFGYGAKTLHRILRFQRFLVFARASDSLARLATTAGFADQSHLAREARRMTAMTPAMIREQLTR